MRRWLTRILICFGLGGVTTVGVAWGFSVTNPVGVAWILVIQNRQFDELWDDDLTMTVWRNGTQGHIVRIWKRIGFVRVEHVSEKATPPEGFDAWYQSYEGLAIYDKELEAPRWSIGSLARNKIVKPPAEHVFDDGCGWPLVALRTRFWFEQNLLSTVVSTQGGVEWVWGRSDPKAIYRVRVIPLIPVWPGFLIDTLFYGVLWLGLFFGLGAARRALRTRRGRCHECGYDLRGCVEPGCPECGWNRNSDAPA